jgi:ATP-dependent DNA ligase
MAPTGDDVGTAFPELVAALPLDIVPDGELLVMRDGAVASFNDLQQLFLPLALKVCKRPGGPM